MYELRDDDSNPMGVVVALIVCVFYPEKVKPKL